MKKVSRSVRSKYMKSFITSASNSGKHQIILSDEEISTLGSLYRYSDVVDVLEGMGNVTTIRSASGNILSLKLTPLGRCYFERLAEERRRLIVNSIILPIMVSIITTVVAVYILPSIGRQVQSWLDSWQVHSAEQPSTAAPIDSAVDNLQWYQALPTPDTTSQPVGGS